jgi:hypothetical protein
VPGITVSTIIDAPPRVVWASVRDIGSHVRVDGRRRGHPLHVTPAHGRGHHLRVRHPVGPLTLTDVMEVTSWVERREMGVRHTGVVTGTGRFTLRRARGGRTRFTWEERLVFPWWLGGRVGGVVGARVLKQIWKGNLRRLAAGFTR